ncbi:hypothetical protein NQD34_005014 [Periophthalmus magnuspinnatus]|nr:hypothetical protein NQD34_005014 [Periophthalmus magnuspinnatus]
MPTHSLLQFVESPDGLAQDILISNSANTPGPGSSMTPHSSCLEKAMLTKVNQLIPCMFCDQTFTHQDELGPHVLAQHPTTFPEPTVLRVEAEFRIPGERNRPKPILPIEKEDFYSCMVCGQISQDALELENHMRKHKDYFYYCCNICGRRFREPWFLKTHMKMHTKSGSKTKALQELQDTPTTINGIVQDVSQPVATVYKMCMVCGFFFPDHDSLAEHSKVHNRDGELRDKNAENWTKEDEIQKETFIQSLKLQPFQENTTQQPVRTSKWIAQLDPFITYQAWQLATKGKIAVGPNHVKDIGQEASTDNEECASDKEELNNILAEGHTVDKANKDGRPAPPPVIMAPPQPQRRSLIQKDKSKERPTTCEECHKTFRTYHQLVLHSRIHKRERPGEESPIAGLEGRLSRPGALEQQDEEEGLEEAPLTEILGSGEDGFDRAKGRSKECSYCGKSFRSSYYLTVHLRTHTGEKPFKCAYCDYAAAQKTSLKYHLDRRHKDKPYIEVPIRPASAASSSSLPSPSDLKLEPDSENSSSPTKLWIHNTKMYQNEAKFDPSLVVDSRPSKQLNQSNGEFAKLITKCADDLPMPVNLKLEKREIKHENYDDAPLNLSLKVSLSISTEPIKASMPSACSQCAFKTIYPEVLIIHKKLVHKDKSDNTRRLAISREKRHTGCPPALDGKDVAPLPMIFRSHPRRTKSPTPLPSKPQENPTTNKTTVTPKQSPLRESDGQKLKTQNEQQANSHESRFTEVMRKNTGGAKYLLDMQTPPDRIGIGERSYPVRNGVLWPTDTSRICLSSRFGNLPRMDLGEPSTKRLKFNSVTQSREEDAGSEKGSFKNVSEMSNRSLVAGRGSIPGAHSSGQDALGTVKSSSVALGGALDSEWGTMNLLRTCTLNDLASLYHTSPGNPPRTGGRTVLYQHLPTLPNLPRRESTGPFPNQRYGNMDKSA